MATFSSMDSSWPERSPTDTMCTIIEGNSFERLSGAAIDSPSRMASRASSTTFSSTTLLSTRLTISSAVSTGTPAASIVDSVRAKRATAT